ncbi:MAG: 16S rRNA (cytidine(1402)-2'-O)-methyltransferase [Thermodesulfobacteriota bacterium]
MVGPGPGTLYVVATPLGNLEDLTFRAARVLKEVALVAAEDTRRTRKLLAHLGASARVLGYREQNHQKVLPRLLEVLEAGGNVALVTDAGTPGVSDPGTLLVREAAARGLPVTPIPGPSAVAAALSAAGLPADGFLFAGFLPAKAPARRKELEKIKDLPRTLVFFEAPHRLAVSLADLARVLGDREAVMCREMTKINEEFRRGGLAGLAREAARRGEEPRGEVTLVVAGAGGRRLLDREELARLIREDERPVREIVADLAGVSNLGRSELYRLVLEVRRGREPANNG